MDTHDEQHPYDLGYAARLWWEKNPRADRPTCPEGVDTAEWQQGYYDADDELGEPR